MYLCRCGWRLVHCLCRRCRRLHRCRCSSSPLDVATAKCQPLPSWLRAAFLAHANPLYSSPASLFSPFSGILLFFLLFWFFFLLSWDFYRVSFIVLPAISPSCHASFKNILRGRGRARRSGRDSLKSRMTAKESYICVQRSMHKKNRIPAFKGLPMSMINRNGDIQWWKIYESVDSILSPKWFSKNCISLTIHRL